MVKLFGVVLFSFTYIGFCAAFVAEAAPIAPLTNLQVFTLCTILPIIGGLSALYRAGRSRPDPVSLLEAITHVGTMGTFGCSTGMALFWAMIDVDNAEFLIVSISGLLGLGGLQTVEAIVDHVVDTAKRWITNKYRGENDDDRGN